MANRRLTFEESAVRHDLKYWGYYAGRLYAADGYPPGQTIRDLMAGKDDRPSHRILIPDMPPKAWDINARIMSLPSELVEALVARYCLPCKADGQPYSQAEIALVLKCKVRTYQYRLADAKRRYQLKIFPNAGLQSQGVV